MPGNGDLYGLIRIREEYPSLPIAVVSGSEDVNIVSKVMGYGAMGFIPKSSSSDDIDNAINQILEGDTWLPKELKNKVAEIEGEDREIAGKSLKIVRNIVMNSKAFKPYEPNELRPGINITDNETLATEAGKFANTIFHPVSTCRMGNDENAVVNDRLVAHGLSNLRIVDASVMPHITSGNTNAPTIMIAEKAADMIIKDNKL